MGASATGTASRTRTSGDSSEAINSNTNASFNSPEGKSLLTYLTGETTNPNARGYLDTAGKAYTAQANGVNNPYTEQVIQTSNKEGDRAFNNGLAGLRAQGYRGGTAANIYGQGNFASDYATKLASQNANLRYGAFNDAQNRSLAGASGLAGLGQGQQSLAAQILALLRGESKDATDIKHTSGTESGTSQSLHASYGMG